MSSVNVIKIWYGTFFAPLQDNVNQIIEIQHKCDRVVSQPKGREGGGGGTPVTSYEFVMPTTKAFFTANSVWQKTDSTLEAQVLFPRQNKCGSPAKKLSC